MKAKTIKELYFSSGDKDMLVLLKEEVEKTISKLYNWRKEKEGLVSLQNQLLRNISKELGVELKEPTGMEAKR